jgi:hypothetical protein
MWSASRQASKNGGPIAARFCRPEQPAICLRKKEPNIAIPGASGQARTFDFQAGDVGYVPFAMAHYIENTAARFPI